MQTSAALVYRFGPFKLYPEQKLLLRTDERLEVDRKSLAVLELLIRNRGLLVTKDRLLDEVWADLNVEEGNVAVQISKVRKVLSDERKPFLYIETVHGEGYRFIGKVEEEQHELYPEEQKPVRFPTLVVAGLIIAAAIGVWLFRLERHKTKVAGDSALSISANDACARYELALKYELEGNDEQALGALNEATSIDKNFSEAYLRAALISNQLGEESQALEYLTQAKNSGGIRDGHQRLQLEALDAELTLGYQESMKKYRLLVDAYPEDVLAQYNFADLAMESRKGFAEANDALDQCLRSDPANRYCNLDRLNLYVLTNEFDKAIDLYGSLNSKTRYPWFDQPFGLALYGKGELARAREVLQNFSTSTRTHEMTKFTSGREWLADIDLFEGKASEASSEIKILLASDSQYAATYRLLYLARVKNMLSFPRDARELALQAVSHLDERDTRVEAAAILACAGYPKDTERMLHLASGESITDLLPETQHYIDGCKALNAGDHKTAVRELQASYDIDDDLGTQFYLAKAYMDDQQWGKATSILKDLEGSKGRIIADESSPPIVWALTHYNLAIVYDETGQKDQAISYLRKFLEIWKSADANLPAVSDAKKRLTAIQRSTPHE